MLVNTLSGSRVLIPLLLLLSMLVSAAPVVSSNDICSGPSIPIQCSGNLTFIENQGQWDEKARFLARLGGMNAWVMDDGVVFDFYKIIGDNDPQWGPQPEHGVIDRRDEPADFEIRGHVVRMQFENGTETSVAAHSRLEGYHNYFIGNDREKWVSYVPLYEEVVISNLYEGVGMRLYDDGGLLRYDLLTTPGADISQIRLRLTGASALRVTDEGDLVMETSLGDILHAGLVAYQEDEGRRIQIPAHFRLLESNVVGFDVASVDSNLPVVIDPLIYSTYFGGSWFDSINDMVSDRSGTAYFTGRASSSDLPTTEGAYQMDMTGHAAAFVTRLNSDGTDLVFSTFIGGSLRDEAFSIAINESGESYITGETVSSDFPITEGSYDSIYKPNFHLKLSADGSDLVYSTFIDVWSASVAVDIDGHAYLAGYVSDDFETTEGAYQTVSSSDATAGLMRMSMDGSSVSYGTYLGGAVSDVIYAISVDAMGSAYVAGYTRNDDFPTTPGAYKESLPPDDEGAVFVTRFTPDGSDLIYSTIIGNGYPNGIAIDDSGTAFVAGFVEGPDFPTTEGSYQTSYLHFATGFVLRLSADGSSLVYSTFLGGSNVDSIVDIDVDEAGGAVVVGTTSSLDFPTTGDAFQSSYPGGSTSGFISKLSPDGVDLTYSTYLGGSNNPYTGNHGEYIHAVSIANSGSTTVAGITNSIDFPTTNNAYMENVPNTAGTSFVTRMDIPVLNIDDTGDSPEYLILGDVYPNPFSVSARILYEVPAIAPIRLEVYDMLGRRVATLLDDDLHEAGHYEVEWVPAGIAHGTYFIRMTSGSSFSQSKHVTVIR